MKPVSGFDELRGDADTIARLANTPFENMIDLEPPADLSEFDVLSTEKERRRAPGDLQAGYMGQRIYDFFGQAVAEVFVLFIRAQICKREHGNARGNPAAARRRGLRLYGLCNGSIAAVRASRAAAQR